MRSRRDLRTGPIPGHFRALAVPAAIGMVFATLYNVVDVYFAGLLSTGEQAGLAITFQIFFILVAFGAGLGSAMGALIGNSLGSDDLGSAKRTACQGLVYGAIVSVVLGVVGDLGKSRASGDHLRTRARPRRGQRLHEPSALRDGTVPSGVLRERHPQRAGRHAVDEARADRGLLRQCGAQSAVHIWNSRGDRRFRLPRDRALDRREPDGRDGLSAACRCRGLP